MSRRVVIFIAVGLVGLTYGLCSKSAAKHREAIKSAEQFARDLEIKLAADPRFDSVNVHVTPQPVVDVRGPVPDQAALESLKSIAVAPPGAKFDVTLTISISETTPVR